MLCRGAASPRSASPMGPAPTRLPRMAFPPPATVRLLRGSLSGKSVAGLEQEPEPDHARDPHQSDANCDAVEVALRHGRAAQSTGHTAPEHVGEPATAPLVEEHQQNHEQARDNEQDLEDDNHGGDSN